MPTTPTALTTAILTFCRQVSQHNSQYLPVKPINGARYRDCYNNVRRKIQADGGKILHGWCIWEEPRFFIEAEHHAIWVSPRGEMVDITPQITGETRILFLPDPEKVWNRIPIFNHRHALTTDPRMKEYFRLADELDASRLKHLRPNGSFGVPSYEEMRIQEKQFALQLKMGMSLGLPFGQIAQVIFGNLSMTPKQRKKLREKLRKEWNLRGRRK